MKGCFITIEGVEGSGKSTQVEKLRMFIEGRGHKVDTTREPGGVPIAEAIREVLLNPNHTAMAPITELLLYEAARAQHVAQRIRPALDSGTWVICDRFADSTTAYQGAGRGLPLSDLANLHALATAGLEPDLTILIDLAAEEGLRRAARDHVSDRIEREAIDFHRRVREEFLRLAETHPTRIKTVDGRLPADSVALAVQRHVASLLNTHSAMGR